MAHLATVLMMALACVATTDISISIPSDANPGDVVAMARQFKNGVIHPRLSDHAHQHFSINEDGAVIVKSSIKHLLGETVSLHVIQPDPQVTKLSISITGPRAVRPIFDRLAYTFNVARETIQSGDVIGVTQVVGHVPDRYVYSLTPPSPILHIDNNGKIQVFMENSDNPRSLYDLRVTAFDKTTLETSNSTSVLINVRSESHSRKRRQIHNDPIYETPYKSEKLFTVYKTPQPGTSYELLSHEDLFRIGPNSGDVFLQPGMKLDYENKDQRNMVLAVRTTLKGTSSNITVQIQLANVNDEKPVFINVPAIMQATIPAQPANNQEVYVLKAVDDWPGTRLVYAIEGGQIENSITMFKIDQGTNQIKVNGVKTFNLGHQYRIQVSVEDVEGQQTTRGMVEVTVGKKAPQFFETRYQADLEEETRVGHSVIKVTAKSFQEKTLSYEFPTPRDNAVYKYFSLATTPEKNGKITVTQILDYEVQGIPKSFVLTVLAKEPGFISSVFVTINLKDKNDNPPSFTLSTYTRPNVRETIALNSMLVAVTATDADFGLNGELQFSVSDDHFRVENTVFDSSNHRTTADILVDRKLDYEQNQSYTFSVFARDNSAVPQSDSATVIVKLINVNDEEPIFIGKMNTTLYEGSKKPKRVGDVITMDPDMDSVNVYFEDPPGSKSTTYQNFKIDPSSGVIHLSRDIDAATSQAEYVLPLVAEDRGDCCLNGGSAPKHRVKANFTVFITDQNTFTPTFEKCAEYRPQIFEHSAPDTLVITVSATDKDRHRNGEVTYSVITPDNKNYVNFPDPKSGRLVVVSTIDREGGKEPLKELSLTVVATDGGGLDALRGFCVLKIAIIDINDNPPEFSFNDIDVPISRALNTDIQASRVHATDPDLGNNSKIVYSLKSNPGGYFGIEADGRIMLKKALSDNAIKTIKITVKATDSGTIPLSTDLDVTFKINDGNDYPPEWLSSNIYTVTVKERATAGIVIANLTAKSGIKDDDIDKFFIIGQDGANQTKVEYDFEYSAFRISKEGNHAVIYKVNQMNYEVLEFYSVVIRVYNKKTEFSHLYADTSLRVNVEDQNDVAPKFRVPDDVNGMVVEHSTDYKREVLALVCDDGDSSAKFRELSFAIKEADMKFLGGKTTDYFYIKKTSSTSAAIYVVAGKEFDREDPRIFDKDRKIAKLLGIEVQVNDIVESAMPSVTGPNRAMMSVSIKIKDVNDNPPKFTKKNWPIFVSEDHAPNMAITTVSANDLDIATSVQYSIVETSSAFTIDKLTGVVTPKSNAHLDYEDPNRRFYNLTLRVTDNIYSDTARLLISITDVNDETPAFTNTTYRVTHVWEDEPAVGKKKKILTVSATDADIDRSKSSWRYFIVPKPEYAEINTITGEIFLTKPLDRDPPNGKREWTFNIEIKDEPKGKKINSGYAMVIVMPRDVNDHTPELLSLQASVKEEAAKGERLKIVGTTRVFHVEAYDYDAGDNGKIDYRFMQQHDLFELDSVSREVLVKTSDSKLLDLESGTNGGVFNIKVLAVDRGTPPRTGTGTMTIKLEDINDNAPEFKKNYTKSISEALERDAVVIEVVATDRDKESKLVYSFRDNEAIKYFQMKSENGKGIVTIFNPLDYETVDQREFRLHIQVTDGISSAGAHIDIRVTDANDNAPVFDPRSLNRELFEDFGDGKIVSFTASDEDSGVNADFTYSIQRTGPAGDSDYIFDITQEDRNGYVTLARNQHLDYELAISHTLNILAIDRGRPAMTGSALLTIKVKDINDNHPILKEGYNVQFMETKTIPVPTLQPKETLRATDIDGPGNRGPFTFSLDCSKSDICSKFEMIFVSEPNEEYGGYAQLRAMVAFDREEQKYYDVPIVLVDDGRPEQTGTVYLRVTIGDENDNEHFDGSKFVTLYNYEEFELPLNHETSLGNVYVADKDDWDLLDKIFTIKGNAPSGITVDQNSGEIKMKGLLAVGSHEFKVEVKDKKWDKTAVGTVTVNVIGITKDAVYSSGSLRMNDITGGEFVSGGDDSKMNKFRKEMALRLGVPLKNVHVFSVMSRGKDTDIRYAAHGSPWKTPVRLDGIVMKYRSEFEKAGFVIGMTPVNECMNETGCESGCINQYVVDPIPFSVNSNDTAFVGVSTRIERKCVCQLDVFNASVCEAQYCYNGGTCYISDWKEKKCKCPKGFDGSRCQKTKISFAGDGWAALPTLTQCSGGATSLEFITHRPNGLLLYNGPYKKQDEVNDFIELRLKEGRAQVSIDHGSGDLVLTVSGPQLNDGQWHRLDVVRDGKKVRLIVDECRSATVTEAGGVSSEDRTLCEASGETWGRNSALNVFTHLQVGGLMSPVAFPVSGSAPSFNGCIKNLRHNSELYDLTPLVHSNAGVGCKGEVGACGTPEEPRCGANGDCIGSLGKSYTCVCHPGYMGDTCSEKTPIRDFLKKSFINWKLQTNPVNQLTTQIQLRLRSRQATGLLFSVRSKPPATEFIIIELVDSHVQVRYNLGLGNVVLKLSSVVAANGAWHTIFYDRVGKFMSLSMDSRDGPYYVDTHGPENGHRLIDVNKDMLVCGARFDGNTIVNDSARDLVRSCVNDIRYNGGWLPMDEGAHSRTAVVLKAEQLKKGCERDDCLNVDCRDENMVCVSLWGEYACRCKPTHSPKGKLCELCCENNGVCQQHLGQPCICPKFFKGPTCKIKFLPTVDNDLGLSTGALALILVAVFLIFLALLGVVLYIHYGWARNKQTILDSMEPYDDIKENAFSYDDEGAGEEDQTAYDLALLSIPIERDTMRKAPPDSYHNQMPLNASVIPDMGDFIGDRLDNADVDPSAPPHDSVREFMHEGGGSSVGSLSSLNTSTTNGDHDYDYLDQWGPKFAKLAELYGANNEADD